MKKIIVITPPELLPREPQLLVTALDAGADYLHIRKPTATTEQLAALLQALPQQYMSRIVLHDAHVLAKEFAIGGLHLNSRYPEAPHWWQGSVSRSCHTFDEVTFYKQYCKYVLLSPIYNSISKPGYKSAFTPETLTTARDRGAIDNHVIAMGGITPRNITATLSYGFGGVAILGCVWCNPTRKHIITTIKNIKSQLQCYNL